MIKNILTRDNARLAISALTGTAAYYVASTALKNNLEDPETKAQALRIKVGVFALASIASTAVMDRTESQFDALFAAAEIAKEEIEEIDTSK